ncbi:hypothetical protein ITP53_37955 [Nonomuraea sp. K274]|uniref:Uncharacterized protein n=1 Tax=Nonomuraea cypriaca TaxID=1187855 RepID=A0A931AJ04_9ACTN|nr:hypothetical protein [Nonomuraea cypriaca]MBF8191388.1 hypothetical protein [Nonomuraea cypriaca]
MTTAPAVPLPEPDDIVVSVMAGIEPDLAEEVVRQAVADAAASRAKRRRLARALTDDPDLLMSGHPEGPAVIGDFVRALLAHGSRRAVLPKCPECGSTKKLTSLRADGKRICQPCDHRIRASSLSCVECSRPARIYRRTRTGEAICRDCFTLPDGDPVDLITAAVNAVAQDADPAAVRRAVESVAPVGNVYLMFRLLWKIEDTPGLLTGEGAKGSARAARLITALTDAGVSVTAPACPCCGEVRPLSHVLNGSRCCLTCYRKSNSAPCGHCGKERAVATRREDGTPLCSVCMRHEADRVITCVLCDRVRPIGRRTKDGPLCRACFRPTLRICSFCGKGPRRCYRAATGMPRCDTCSRARRTCLGCGKNKHAAARTEDGHLCETCWQKNPISFNPCRLCGTVEYLHSYGRCHSCVHDQQVRQALSRDGAMRPGLQPVHDVLVAGGAKAGLSWLERPSARTILDALADGTCPPTHEGLDALLPNKSVAFLRAALVTAGVLPARDERFAALEQWIASATEAVPDDGERKLVRRFATWHHLRRLRRQAAKKPVTSTQATAVRASIRAAVALLIWLGEHGTDLQHCTKVHLDEWIDGGTTTRYDARGFLECIGLSTQLPAAVLTELLGISPETATAWTQEGGHWARYAATVPAKSTSR